MSTGIRAVIAEDSLLVREGIARVLDAGGIEVLAECGDLPELMVAVDALSPEVVVTDVRMPPDHGDEGIQAATLLRYTHPGLGVVVLSQYAEPAYASALLAEGSAGRAYLLKESVSQPGQLVQAVRAVVAGGSVVDPAVVEALVRDRRKHVPSPLEELTAPERSVLEEIALGKSNAGIAKAMQLSERTVEKHINTLFAKLGLAEERDVNRRVMAVLVRLRSQP